MNYSKNDFSQKIENQNKAIKSFTLPSWNELPLVDLYMDQVIVLMNKYLNGMISCEESQSFAITAPMINNYVKLKAMPAPVKKRYSRTHLAYLIMICSLKHALNIPTIQKIIPMLENENDVKQIYEIFCHNQQKSFMYIADQIETVSQTVLCDADEDPSRLNDLALQIAISANLFKILAEDIAATDAADR